VAWHPAPDWLRHYRKEWLGADAVAGLTTAAVVIPKAMAYATVAGLAVQVGLYTALVPMLVYAWLGTSRPLSVSTTTTIAILTGVALAEAVPSGDAGQLLGATAALALMVGVALLLAAALRLGFVANFISEPVLVGFKAGIGLVIVVDQVPKLLGIDIAKGGFGEKLVSILQALPEAVAATVAVGVATLGLLAVIERLLPRVPAPLVAVAAGIAAMAVLGLEALGVKTIGSVPTGLPALTLPDWHLIAQLWPAALGIALMSFTETVAAARAFAHPDEPHLQPNRELVATGIGNLAGAFAGAMPSGGGTSQTAVNRAAGARSQMAQLVTAGAVLGTLLLLAPFVGLMPEATLAAVVIVYSVGLIEPREFREILRVRRTEFLWALAALGGVVVLGTLQGIVVAVIVSFIGLIYQVADPPVHVLGRKPGTSVFRPRPDGPSGDESFPGVLLVRPEGRLFFANVERVGQKINELIEVHQPRVLVLDLAGVFDLEYTALKALVTAEQRLAQRGVTVVLTNLTPGVHASVRKSALGAVLGPGRMFRSLEEAVARYAPSASGLRTTRTEASPGS
jgi:SulP family sulfate permease